MECIAVVVLDCVIGLGSNEGDRRAWLSAAVAALAARAEVTSVSSLYETAPVGGVAQGDFLNAAVRVSFRAAPSEAPDAAAFALLDALLAIEARFGRVRKERWGPRTLDLDLLWIHGVAVRSATLTVPHPGLKERAFALIPLLEVAPEAVDPETGERLAARRAGAAGEVRRMASAETWLGASGGSDLVRATRRGGL